MAAKMPSVSETVDQILREAGESTTIKTSQFTPVGKIVPPLKKIANALRELPAPALTYPVLHVVKTAMMNGRLAELPALTVKQETGTGLPLELRKLANALREEDAEDHTQLLAKGAHTLRATRGIMLLRDLVRE